MRRASDFDRIAPHLALWHAYDPGVKAELYSTGLTSSGGTYLIDPVPLRREALAELVGYSCVAGVIVASSNHHRASVQIAEQFSAPLFARSETFLARRRTDSQRFTPILSKSSERLHALLNSNL